MNFSTVKKFAASAIVIVSFLGYVLYQNGKLKFLGAENPKVIPPSASGGPSVGSESANPTTQGASAPPPQRSGGGSVKATAYKDGRYVGPVTDAFYGQFQTKVVIQKGKIVDVQFPVYPNDRATSVRINTEAMPYWKAEAIQAQSANVDIVTGATQSSLAFQESLTGALAQAHQ